MLNKISIATLTAFLSISSFSVNAEHLSIFSQTAYKKTNIYFYDNEKQPVSNILVTLVDANDNVLKTARSNSLGKTSILLPTISSNLSIYARTGDGIRQEIDFDDRSYRGR